jgi:hypothetical protein
MKEKDKREDESESTSLASVLKEEVLVLGFLILYVGIVSADAYYRYFGVKYQLLNLPSVQYRGSILLFYSPSLLVPFTLVAIWLIVDRYAMKTYARFRRARHIAVYVVMLLILLIAYQLAVRAGMKEAEKDMYETSSSLPKVVKLVTAKETLIGADSNLRLLMVDEDFVIVFEPLKPSETEAFPHMKRFAKGDVNVIETSW